MVFKRLAEASNRRAQKRAAGRQAAFDAERQAEQDRKHKQARREQDRKDRVAASVKAMQADLNRRAAAREKKLAPLGAPIEQAVDAGFAVGGHSGGTYTYSETPNDDSFRPTVLALARKFMRPDEQFIGALRVEGWGTKIALVVFTRGFAAKIKGQTFRTDVKPEFVTETPTSILGDKDEAPHVAATLTIGGTTLTVRSDETTLFDALWLQHRLRTQSKPRTKTHAKGNTPPAARLIRTARDAELVAAEWMTYLGYTNVASTPVGADGGVDVTSDQAVTQVKAESIPVGRPKIQQHHGVGIAHGKQALFFSLSGYTPQAKAYAQQNGIVLFTFDLQGVPQ